MIQLGRTSAWQMLQRRTRHGDIIFRLVTFFFALIVIFLVVAIGYVIWGGSREARQTFGLAFLFQQGWNPVTGNFGALPAMYGTLVSSGIALVCAGPLGVLIGVFLTELCPVRLKAPLSFLVELLAAIPSVIYGMWGVFVLVPFFRSTVSPLLSGSLGRVIPFFAGPTSGQNLMVAGFILAIMVLPTVASISRDVLAVVPNHQREALLALGATRWEMIRHAVLPGARAGIIGALMLGLGRALGETMAALMVIGSYKPAIPDSWQDAGITAAALIASELPNANDTLHESTLILIALVLFGITLLLNACARLLVWNAARGPGGNVRA